MLENTPSASNTIGAGQLVVEIDGPPLLFPPAEPAAASRICAASRHLHRHYRMRRKRRAARRRPPSGGPQFNVKTLGRHGISRGKFVASSYRPLAIKRNIAFTVREPRASQSHRRL